jgi:hypothetical protein
MTDVWSRSSTVPRLHRIPAGGSSANTEEDSKLFARLISGIRGCIYFHPPRRG